MKRMAKLMTARIENQENGMQEYNNVSLIQIKSSDYTLQIVEGYTPSIGEIDGSVRIVSGTDSVSLENVKGFFFHKQDIFRLLLKEE
jgi:hypothetical protein